MSIEQSIAAEVVRMLKEEGLVVNGRPSDSQKWLSVPEAAKYLKRSQSSVRQMIASGKIPKHVFRVVGGRKLIVKSELERWLEQQ